MDAIDAEVGAVVVNGADPSGIGRVEPGFTVPVDGVVGPAPFPQLVDGLHVVVGDFVAVVMRDLVRQAHRPSGALEVAFGNDVPADAAFGEVVERRHASGENVWRFVAEVGRHAEAKVGGGVRHGGHEQERVVHRNLDRVTQRRARAAAINVVDTQHVGQE